MSAQTFTTDDVERLASKLDSLCSDLDDDERRLLGTIFALAGRSYATTASKEEVSGFDLDANANAMHQMLQVGGGLFSSFQWGGSAGD
jgi:hypothetical protein